MPLKFWLTIDSYLFADIFLNLIIDIQFLLLRCKMITALIVVYDKDKFKL